MTAHSEVVLYADHTQFYVVDAGAFAAEDDDGDVDRASLEDRIAVRPGSLTIFTATYGYVRVVVERLAEPAGNDLALYDHVVEAPFAATSGRISVLAVTEVEAELMVPPGEYVARIAWSGVEGADERDPPPDDPLETILIQLWPGHVSERRVVKWYEAWKPAADRPTNPYGLRVAVGPECDALTDLRVVGEPKDAEEDDDRSLVRDADGTYWLHYYSPVPPHSEVRIELPESELRAFHLRPQPPRLELAESEARATISLPPPDRYRYFVDAVRRSGWLWTLEDGQSPVEWQDENDREYVLAWPHPRFAEVYAEEEAPGSGPVAAELAEWLAALDADFVVVFPISMFDQGQIVAADVLADELRD